MKIEVYVHTGLVGSEQKDILEIDDEDLKGMSDIDREDYIEHKAREFMFNMIDWGYREVKD